MKTETVELQGEAIAAFISDTATQGKNDRFNLSMSEHRFVMLNQALEFLQDFGGRLSYQNEINQALGEMIKNSSPRFQGNYIEAMKYFNELILLVRENHNESIDEIKSAMDVAADEAKLW